MLSLKSYIVSLPLLVYHLRSHTWPIILYLIWVYERNFLDIRLCISCDYISNMVGVDADAGVEFRVGKAKVRKGDCMTA